MKEIADTYYDHNKEELTVVFTDSSTTTINFPDIKTIEVPKVSEVNKLKKDLKSAIKRIEQLENKTPLGHGSRNDWMVK